MKKVNRDVLYFKLFLQKIENPVQSTLFKCLSKLSRIFLPNAYEIKTFLYSITLVVLSKFCLSLLQMHFSASMLHLFSELWWKKTIIRKSLNWIITLLWNYYKKSWGKVDSRAETKMRMKWSIEIHTENWDYNFFQLNILDK